MATPAEKPVASRVNDLSLQTALKAAPGSKGLVRRVTNLGSSLFVYDGPDSRRHRPAHRQPLLTATDITGKRISTFASMIEATRALPTVTTIINNKPAQRGRAGLKVHPTEGSTRLLHAD